jgi:hypothetical protein
MLMIGLKKTLKREEELDLAKAPVNNEKPEKVMINPPAIFNEFKVIPKNIKINILN